jgi:hypothetical protein
MKWFGEPWPSAELPAPVCESDDDKIATPVGAICPYCTVAIAPDARGVAIPYLGSMSKHMSEPLAALNYHARCLLASVVGDDLAAYAWREFS